MTTATIDPVTQEIIRLVVSLVERMHAHFANVTADFGLSPMEGRALFVLEEPLPMGELAGALHCDASYITGITDRLEEQGLVERQVYANDRRVKHLVLTIKGKQLRTAMLLRTEQDLPATAGLTNEQCKALRALLRVSQQAGPAVSVDNVDTAC
jgi:DNA-binding MarR family transcriptional regulator